MSKQAEADNDAISREIVSRYLKFYVNENTWTYITHIRAYN
jgi:hypothetical protein